VFVEKDLRQLLGPHVQLVSTGEPVARQTQRLLSAAQLLNPQTPHGAEQPIRMMTTGDLQGLQAAAQRWLGLPPEVCVAVPDLLR
jgi:glutamate racemase